MADEIIQEVWRCKDRLASKFNYDLDALAAELRKRQKRSGRKPVNLAKKAAKRALRRSQ